MAIFHSYVSLPEGRLQNLPIKISRSADLSEKRETSEAAPNLKLCWGIYSAGQTKCLGPFRDMIFEQKNAVDMDFTLRHFQNMSGTDWMLAYKAR